MKKLLATITTAGVLVLGTGATALAAPDGGGTGSGAPKEQPQRHHPRRAALRIAGGAAAETIGISRSELRAAIQGGQSVADVAESKGVDPGAVQQAVEAALTEAIDKAVSVGRIDPERAAKLKEHVADFADRVVHTVPKRFQQGGSEPTAI